MEIKKEIKKITEQIKGLYNVQHQILNEGLNFDLKKLNTINKQIFELREKRSDLILLYRKENYYKKIHDIVLGR